MDDECQSLVDEIERKRARSGEVWLTPLLAEQVVATLRRLSEVKADADRLCEHLCRDHNCSHPVLGQHAATVARRETP
jgi:hypothetical protein